MTEAGHFIENVMDTIKYYLSMYYEWTFLVLGIFLLVAAWRDWNWVFDPPYHSIKNPVGFFFGRKAYRTTWFATGIFVILISCGLICLKLSLKG